MSTRLAPNCPQCGRCVAVRHISAITREAAPGIAPPMAQRFRFPSPAPPPWVSSESTQPVPARLWLLLGALLGVLTYQLLTISRMAGLITAVLSMWLLAQPPQRPQPAESLAISELHRECWRAYQRARTRYAHLVYCQNCDCVFVPGEPRVAQPEAMETVLYQKVSVWRGQEAELDVLFAEDSPSKL